jgi:hypothetical protein
VWGIELALGLGGLALAQVHPSATLFWPVIGFDLAFLLQFGARVLPIIWVGAFAMNIVTFGTFVTCIIIASGNVAKVYVASKLFGGGRYSGHHFTRFVVSCFPAAVIGGTIGTAALVLNDYKSGFGLHEFWLYIIEHWSQGDHAGLLAFVTWMNWIVGDFLGMIIFTPIFETYLVKIKKRVGYA